MILRNSKEAIVWKLSEQEEGLQKRGQANTGKGKDQISDFVGYYEDFGFYTWFNEEPLDGFEQRKDMIGLNFQSNWLYETNRQSQKATEVIQKKGDDN